MGIMDYRTQLLKPMAPRFIDHIAKAVLDQPSDLQKVYSLAFDEEETIAWRAAWACQKISESRPEWFTENMFRELTSLAISTTNQGIRRGCLSTLYNLQLPDPVPVELINSCLEWMISPREAIAIQAKSMRLLLNICNIIPEFRTELRYYLDTIDHEHYSAGFKSSRKNVLKELARQSRNQSKSSLI